MILSKQAEELFKESFHEDHEHVFFSHGRAEIIGNHTDHQGGTCLVAGVDLGITAAVSKNQDGAFRVVSAGFAPFMFFLDELEPLEEEKGTTIALFKGVVRYFKDHGLNVGGFSAALRSDLPAGSGLSSSAAVEGLVAEILDVLYNDGKVSAYVKSLAGQYAENIFFGKPCGLLDQIGVNYGGLAYLDFGKSPIEVTPVPWINQLRIVLVNTGGSHVNLTDAYASIPNDMLSVAKNLLGVERLGQADASMFLSKVSLPTEGVTETAKLRAQHFYDEVKRVTDARHALEEGDAIGFFHAISMSQESSKCLLRNTFLPGEYDHSPQQACDIASEHLHGGACRITGGGFAGSILCFVYENRVKDLVAALSAFYGEEAVLPLSIVPGGAKLVR